MMSSNIIIEGKPSVKALRSQEKTSLNGNHDLQGYSSKKILITKIESINSHTLREVLK